jgi:hypothetical protein
MQVYVDILSHILLEQKSYMYDTLSFMICLRNLPDFVLIKEFGIINPNLFEDFSDFSKKA